MRYLTMMNRPLVENTSLYSMVELGRASLGPAKALINLMHQASLSPLNPMSSTPLGKMTTASCEVLERILKHYPKPEFGITKTHVNNKEYNVVQKTIIKKTFCNLLHFEKQKCEKLPKLLIVAPLSGHHATLLRGTVEATLPHYDVYITDWLDAKLVPVSEGKFGFGDYLKYCVEFMEHLAPNLNVMAVCQPAVPVIAGVALMHSAGSNKVPDTMTLIGGPIDTQKSPTGVNDYAKSKSLVWFEQNVVSRVPINYPGRFRPVYPGFLQLIGFMSMNLKRHVGEQANLFKHLVSGDGESADKHKKFYDEYLAVLDLPAEFYIETLEIVFHDHSLPENRLVVDGKKVDLRKIDRTALLVIEGELDDISGVGQTKAAIDLCTNIKPENKKYILQMGVGHYGIFNGKKFRDVIVPEIFEFTSMIQGRDKAKTANANKEVVIKKVKSGK